MGGGIRKWWVAGEASGASELVGLLRPSAARVGQGQADIGAGHDHAIGVALRFIAQTARCTIVAPVERKRLPFGHAGAGIRLVWLDLEVFRLVAEDRDLDPARISVGEADAVVHIFLWLPAGLLTTTKIPQTTTFGWEPYTYVNIFDRQALSFCN